MDEFLGYHSNVNGMEYLLSIVFFIQNTVKFRSFDYLKLRHFIY